MKCKMCGQPLEAHRDLPYGPLEPLPRVPCLLLKKHFIWDEVNVDEGHEKKTQGFTYDQVVVFNGNTPFKMLAQPGAMAKIKGIIDGLGRQLIVEWMDSPLRNGQPNGQYLADSFSPVPEVSRDPWFSFRITKEVLRQEVLMYGIPATILKLHTSLQQLVEKILNEPIGKVDLPPQPPQTPQL